MILQLWMQLVIIIKVMQNIFQVAYVGKITLSALWSLLLKYLIT